MSTPGRHAVCGRHRVMATASPASGIRSAPETHAGASATVALAAWPPVAPSSVPWAPAALRPLPPRLSDPASRTSTRPPDPATAPATEPLPDAGGDEHATPPRQRIGRAVFVAVLILTLIASGVFVYSELRSTRPAAAAPQTPSGHTHRATPPPAH